MNLVISEHWHKSQLYFDSLLERYGNIPFSILTSELLLLKEMCLFNKILSNESMKES